MYPKQCKKKGRFNVYKNEPLRVPPQQKKRCTFKLFFDSDVPSFFLNDELNIILRVNAQRCFFNLFIFVS